MATTYRGADRHSYLAIQRCFAVRWDRRIFWAIHDACPYRFSNRRRRDAVHSAPPPVVAPDSYFCEGSFQTLIESGQTEVTVAFDFSRKTQSLACPLRRPC